MIKLFVLLSQIVFAAPTAQNIDGAYTKPCYFSDDADALTSHLKIQGSNWTLSHVAYEDNKCETPYLIFDLAYTAKTDGQNVDMTAVQATYTSLSEVVTGVLNQIQWCGFSDWKTNEPKNASGRTCEDFVPPRTGDVLYSTFLMKDDSHLYLGMDSKGFNGKTPATRHKQIDNSPFNRD